MIDGTLYFVRHGQTHWNRDLRLQGQKDSPLTLKGVHQVVAYGRCLAERLKGGPRPVLIASPLGRAAQSAALVAEQLAIPYDAIRFDDLLKERNQGILDGLNRAEIAATHAPPEQERRRWDYAAPGGESMAQVFERSQRFLASLPAGQTTVVVAHGVVSRALRAAYLGLTPDQVAGLERHEQDRLFRLADGHIERVVCAGHV